MEKNKKFTNRLAKESSPYLLQHAHNPVDWYPWSDEAFETAVREDKPIFLSIGYSTCHWCHVMARECFENVEVASSMSDTFISIKVDREERPDIDSVYMEAAMVLNGNGGWPLNVILTPDLQPIFAATYIPREGMLSLVPQVASAWKDRRDELIESGRKITEALQGRNHEITAVFSPEDAVEDLYTIFDTTFKQLDARYDPQYGGFGEKPKFPQAHNFLFLLRHYLRTGNEKALEITEKSLQAIRAGGIYDQIGYGFHRYSTDKEWLVPHFEKMLYDQAMLLLAYGETYLITKKEIYRKTGSELLDYLLRDMVSPEGAFYSAEDADSEGVEGKYYLWDYAEFSRLLGNKGGDYAGYYNVLEEGNYLDEARRMKTGNNILHTDIGSLPPEETEKFEETRKHLFQYREERVRPHVDDKILTDWNGLMIYALARASWIFGDKEYYGAAEKAAGFIARKLMTDQGQLIHSYRDGKKGTPGMLDDYAFFIRALIELYQAGFNPEYLQRAVIAAEYARNNFEDRENGGFFLSSENEEHLLIRKKELMDNAIPSGNSVMLDNFLMLYRFIGKEEYRSSAEGILKTSSNELESYPQAFPMLLSALHGYTEKPREIVITGNEPAVSGMIAVVRQTLRPGTVVLLKTENTSKALGDAAEFTESYPIPEEGAAAYVCENFACRRPVYTAEQLLELLS